MEFIKEKLPIVIGTIVFLALCCGAYYFLVYQSSAYYTQIDNTKIESISSSDGMNYEYTLTCYDKNGKEKEIKFKTSRELREDAYLELTYMMTRGVSNWKEVQYDELPDKVQDKYTNVD